MRERKVDKTIIGLDIGSDSIRLVKGRQGQGKIYISDFASRQYAVSEGTPDLTARHIHELLTSIMQARKLKKARIHSTISGRKLCIRVVRLPVMPEEELYQVVRSKVRKYVSEDLDQVIFNFSVSGEVREKEFKKLEVVFIAIQKPSFDSYLQPFNSAGIEPKAITATCFSAWNLIRQAGLDKGAPSLMLINVANEETELTVFKEGRFVFTRNISVGGRDFAGILKNQSQFSLDAPEDINQLWGLEEKPPLLQTAKEATLMKIRSLLQSQANILCKEIELTAHHYYQTTHGRGIDKSIIIGEGSQTAGLVDFLKQNLEIPLENLSIPEGILQLPAEKEREFRKNFTAYTQALGALLVKPEDINLAGKAHLQVKRRKGIFALFPQLKMTVAVPIFLISLGLVILTVSKTINSYYRYQIKSYKKRQDKLEERAMQLVQIRRKMDMLDFEKELYLRLIKEHPPYSLVIAEICRAASTEKIVLNKLKFYRAQKRTPAEEGFPASEFSISGSVLGEDLTGSEATEFVLVLEQSGYFENISLTIAGEQEARLNFIIKGVIRSEE